MRVSVVIPVYHRPRLLRMCLEAIRDSTVQPDEIIVVDDASTDETAAVAKQFDCTVLINEFRAGQAFSKNQAVAVAKGDIFVCVDSDVVVEPDAIEKLRERFEENPEYDALIGMPNIENEFHSFASQYKSTYMRHLFRKLPEEIDFIHGSFVGYRRELFQGRAAHRFDESVWCDDVEIGCRLAASGKRIGFVRDAGYTHHRKHTLRSLLFNDFRVSKEFIKILVSNNLTSLALLKRRFAHTSLGQALSVCCSFGGSLLAIAGALTYPTQALHLGLILLTLSLLMRGRFFCYLARKKGLQFLASSVLFTIIDHLAFAWGIAYGALDFAKERILIKWVAAET